MATGVRRIVLLTPGYEELPKSVSLYGAPPSERMREPAPGVLLQADCGWLLLDAGFNTGADPRPGAVPPVLPERRVRAGAARTG